MYIRVRAFYCGDIGGVTWRKSSVFFGGGGRGGVYGLVMGNLLGDALGRGDDELIRPPAIV